MTVSLKNRTIDAELLQLIRPQQAWQCRVIPIEKNNGTLKLAIDEEADIKAISDELHLTLDNEFKLVPVSKDEINYGLGKYYRLNNQSKQTSLGKQDNFLDKIIEEAGSSKASDIHIEPNEKSCNIRFRIDGHLVEKFKISKEDYFTLLNQIKIKSNLDIAEKRLPQDGRILMESKNALDLRVSILPTLTGEKIVMRLLGKEASIFDLEKLGFTDAQIKVYQKAIHKKSGIILISGPTNSGKTTTLYATISQLNKKDTNILTAENPVEYSIDGVNQVQIKESIGLTFAAALRSFLRQDPDIIMVGEIRDRETAEMAIRASLTGHLVLSTIHTNSAIGTVTRLIDEGVEPYLIADTLNISIAQRLIRKLCHHCRIQVTLEDIEPDDLLSNFLSEKNAPIYQTGECANCHYTGYSGRVAIYEVIPIDNQIGHYIRNNELATSDNLIQYTSLRDRASELLLSGQTSWDEVKQYIIE